MQLIQPEEVLGYAFSPDDPIAPSHVRPSRIEAAQLRYIRPAFGDAMYRKMLLERYDEFVSGYIKPALAHYVRYELIGELAVRASDHGVVRPSSEESVQTTSATKNDKSDRTDATRAELNRLTASEKSTSGTTGRKTTSQSTDTETSDETNLRQGKDQRTVTVTDSDRTTSQDTVSEQIDASISVTVTEKNATNQSTVNKKTLDDTIVSQENAKNVSRTDTSKGTQEVTGTDSGTAADSSELNDVTTKDVTVAATARSENTGMGSTTRTTLKAATAEEWQLLSRQALRDARTFLRYAVEYVEAHREEFPDYDPASGLGASAARRCIGGIIL